MRLHCTMLEKGAQAAIRRISSRLHDFTGAFEVIGHDLERSVEANFNAESARAAGGSWPGWSKAYGEWRAKRKPGKILTLNARLRRSINSRPDPRGVTVGTNVAYAAIHQFGGEIARKAGSVSEHSRSRRTKSGRVSRRGGKAVMWKVAGHERRASVIKMPARPYLVFQPEDLTKAQRTVEDFIRSVIP